MDIKKILAGYNFFVDPSISNISELSYNLKEIGFDPEEVIGLNPDVVIASKYTDVDTIAILKDSKIPVIRAELDNSAEGNIPNILFMGYILGAEKEAAVLEQAVEKGEVSEEYGLQKDGVYKVNLDKPPTPKQEPKEEPKEEPEDTKKED